MIHHPDVIPMRPLPGVTQHKPRPVKVFTDSACAQLGRLNKAARIVRDCGARILAQRLDGIEPLGGRPVVKIAAANRALLDQAGPPTTLETPTGTIVHVRLEGVQIMWEVPR